MAQEERRHGFPCGNFRLLFRSEGTFGLCIRNPGYHQPQAVGSSPEELEEKFSKAFLSNPAAIVIIDLSSESYLDVNRTFEQLTGFRRNEVVGRQSSRTVH